MRPTTRDGAPPRLVVMRPGALGDTLLTLPTLAWLRRAWPNVHILFVARRDVLPLARCSGLADDVSPYDAPIWTALFAATAPPALTAHHLTDMTAALAWLADADGTVQRNFAALGARQIVIAPVQPGTDDPTHVALMLASAVAALGIRPPTEAFDLLDALPPLRGSQEDRHLAEHVWHTLALADETRPIVALHAGSGSAAKRWPPERFAAIASLLRDAGAAPLLLEGPQDEAITRAIQNALPSAAALPLPVASALPVGAVAALLQHCSAYVGNDSGVTHLAALLGLPVLALFGPTNPTHWAPIGRRVHVIRSPTGHLADIPVPLVAATVIPLLAH